MNTPEKWKELDTWWKSEYKSRTEEVVKHRGLAAWRDADNRITMIEVLNHARILGMDVRNVVSFTSAWYQRNIK